MTSCEFPEDFLYAQVPQDGPDGTSGAELSQQQLEGWLSRLKTAIEACSAAQAALIAANTTAIANFTAASWDYSTTEFDTGRKWIDGTTPVYGKVIALDSLPNNASKNFAHGITGLAVLIEHHCIVTNGTNHFAVPNASTLAITANIAWAVDSTNIIIATGNDRTAFGGYAFLVYTKT